MALPEREKAIRLRLRDDLGHYASRCLKIRDKRGRIAPLVLNVAQQHIHRKLEQQREAQGLIRALVLKGRQQGCSTYVEGRYYWRTTHSKGVRAYILTHEDKATQNLFEMAARYHKYCPPLVKPRTGASNAKELYFDLLDSGYQVGTAGSKSTGRSSTLQLFHGSEVAYWPNAEQHLAGVMQAVPWAPDTEIILESTAFGVGGVFHDYWIDAENGRNDYRPVFVPWFWQPEYVRETDGFEPTDEEQRLAKRFGLSFGQLAWRRAKIAELRSEDLFRQEYPCTPEEAFIYSGRQAFDPNALAKAREEVFAPKYRADVDTTAQRLVKRDDGPLRVWEEPQPGEHYVIGADVAEGLIGGDYSCADVLAASDGRQVAQWHGHVDPDRFGDILAALGHIYRKAVIGPERNNHGLTTVTALRNGGYPRLYAQEDIERRAEGHETKKAGWLTTRKSKVKIIDQLAAELRDEQHGIACAETIEEMATFAVHEDGTMGAKPGCFDDRVMSRAIAGEMLLTVPRHWRRRR